MQKVRKAKYIRTGKQFEASCNIKNNNIRVRGDPKSFVIPKQAASELLNWKEGGRRAALLRHLDWKCPVRDLYSHLQLKVAQQNKMIIKKVSLLQAMKAYRGCGCKGPQIRSLSTRKRQDLQSYAGSIYPRQSPGTNFTGGSVDPRTSLHKIE